MPRIFLCHAFANEYVPQMPAAVGTQNLGTRTVGVRLAKHCAFDFIIKAWPTAITFEFVDALVQGSITTTADVGSWHLRLPVLTRERSLRTFLQDHVAFLRR